MHVCVFEAERERVRETDFMLFNVTCLPKAKPSAVTVKCVLLWELVNGSGINAN